MILEDLKGKNALLTGAGGGIVRAAAKVFAEQGVNLILCDINEEALQETAREIEKLGVEVITVVTDVSKSADVKHAVMLGAERFKHIDILLNGAGISLEHKINELPEEIWEKIIGINLSSVYMFSKEVANHMIKNDIKGKIISISSQDGKKGKPGFGAYGCSKSAIITLTQSMSAELAEYGINVNAVCPGYIDTEMSRRIFNIQAPREGISVAEYEDRLCASIPMGRLADPREVANLMVYLASGGASYITGVAITIAGGALLI